MMFTCICNIIVIFAAYVAATSSTSAESIDNDADANAQSLLNDVAIELNVDTHKSSLAVDADDNKHTWTEPFSPRCIYDRYYCIHFHLHHLQLDAETNVIENAVCTTSTTNDIYNTAK